MRYLVLNNYAHLEFCMHYLYKQRLIYKQSEQLLWLIWNVWMFMIGTYYMKYTQSHFEWKPIFNYQLTLSLEENILRPLLFSGQNHHSRRSRKINSKQKVTYRGDCWSECFDSKIIISTFSKAKLLGIIFSEPIRVMNGK